MSLSSAEIEAYTAYQRRMAQPIQFARSIAGLPPEMDPTSPKYRDPVDPETRERADIITELERNRRAKAERAADQATFDRYDAENQARAAQL
jgi:hypothetical protein